MKRFFEKISFEQFKKDISDNRELYDSYKLPERSTRTSAGYDFFALDKIVIGPGEIKKIPTGYKVSMQDDELLLICVRSSTGFKYNVRMCNQIAIVENDYYNNESNEGHLWIALQNHSDKEYVLEKNNAYVQGIFLPFLTCDDIVDKKRGGGLGSTTKKEGNKNE